jgi:ABC-2 type transport system permease protein
MNAAVLRHALAQVHRTIGLLAVGAGAFFYLVLLASSSFVNQLPEVPFFRTPPKALTAFLGGSIDFFHPSGWLANGMTHPVTLALLSSAALAVASGAVATEIERGTLDLVLSRPVGRTPFLVAKAVASVAAVASVEVGGFAGVLIARLSTPQVSGLPLARAALAFFDSFLLFAALAMVGVLVSARSSLRGAAIGTSVGLIVMWFFMNFIGLLFDEVSAIRYASPFH